jgi:hypothetical protein
MVIVGTMQGKYPASISRFRKPQLCLLGLNLAKPPIVRHDRGIYTHLLEKIPSDDQGALVGSNPLEQFANDPLDASVGRDCNEIGEGRRVLNYLVTANSVPDWKHDAAVLRVLPSY